MNIKCLRVVFLALVMGSFGARCFSAPSVPEARRAPPNELGVAGNAARFAHEFEFILASAHGADELESAQNKGTMRDGTWGPREDMLLKQLLKTARDALQNARQEAFLALKNIHQLAEAGNFYLPAEGTTSDRLFNLDSAAVAREYLAREIARTSVLCGYAGPYVSLLQNSAVSSREQRENAASALLPYWENTITALNLAVHSKDPAGSVGRLDQLVTEVVVDLSADNCAQRLAKLPVQQDSPKHDLFSEAYGRLLTRARELCAKKRPPGR